ncbi:MAG TPA: PhzF family phenazine biosynthesis protein [Acidimicrobiales bacterium]|nr:PhzF family phenazine biosynthesis protein [Acidimicrobiales bacterium]
MTSTPLFQVDAFTDRAFAGNPAGVALLDAPADESWMLDVAAEMNLAETAFLVRAAAGRYGLRWFSPTVEIDLCGHATLASAHVLWTEGRDDSDVLAFDTKSGELRARRVEDGRIELDFPANTAVDAELDPRVLGSLAVTPVRTATTTNGWVLAELPTADDVRKASPDLVALGACTEHAVVITAAGDGDADIVSRVFAPASGIPEDPVTGSAHCLLATWWWDRVGKDQIDAEQASGRGGRLLVTLDGDRVRLRGRAVTTIRGELLV